MYLWLLFFFLLLMYIAIPLSSSLSAITYFIKSVLLQKWGRLKTLKLYLFEAKAHLWAAPLQEVVCTVANIDM